MDPNAHTQYRFLYDLLANPNSLKTDTAANLHQLVKSFPQSGLIQALYVYANEGHNPQRAIAGLDPLLVHKLINSPQSFRDVQPGQVFHQQNKVGLKGTPAPQQPAFTRREIVHEPAAETEIIEAPVYEEAENVPAINVEQEIVNTPEAEINEEVTLPETIEETPEPVAETEPAAEAVTEHVIATEEIVDIAPEPVAAEQLEPITETTVAAEAHVETEQTPVDEENTPETQTEESPAAIIYDTNAGEKPVAVSVNTPETEIEEEVYDEIVSIDDIAIDVNNTGESTFHESTVLTIEDPFSAEDTRLLMEEVADTTPYKLNDEADKLIVGNIAATDYFMFDKAFGKIEETETTQKDELPQATVLPEPVTPVAEPEPEVGPNEVSAYHDEKMPYSFLWWLDKTRKEHSGIYQPYTKSPLRKAERAEAMTTGDALQQQYIENIFHLTSVEQLDISTAQNATSAVKHKTDVIIERFIKEEPQIKPPVSARLDTENKAKKSSDDNDGGLVSETLAKIYTDQMLYPKAIAVYKKLMLKFPEKSRYFADHIKSLEKRTS